MGDRTQAHRSTSSIMFFSTQVNLIFSLYLRVDPGLCPEESFAIPGRRGVYIASDLEINPQLVDLTSKADVTLLSKYRYKHTCAT